MTASPGHPVSNSSSSDSSHDKVPAISPGEQLQKARKERKLEIPAVAEQLNLSPGVVRALEADDYRMLPNATFVKGYLRSYARLLGIAGDDLVRAYEAITGCNKPVVMAPVAPPRIRQSGNSLKYSVIALLVAGLLGLVLWLMPGEPERSEPPMAIVTDPAALASADDGDLDDTGVVKAESGAGESQVVAEDQDSESRDSESGFSLVTPQAAVTSAGSPVSMPEPAPAAAESVAAAPVVAVPTGAASPETTPAPASAEPMQAEPAQVETAQIESAQADSAPYVPQPGRGMLKLAFSGDCWVEVRDVRGKMVFSSLKRAGDDVTLNVAVPVSVKLGNGDVVAVNFNHEPVAFSTTPSRKVVRLTLGENR